MVFEGERETVRDDRPAGTLHSPHSPLLTFEITTSQITISKVGQLSPKVFVPTQGEYEAARPGIARPLEESLTWARPIVEMGGASGMSAMAGRLA